MEKLTKNQHGQWSLTKSDDQKEITAFHHRMANSPEGTIPKWAKTYHQELHDHYTGVKPLDHKDVYHKQSTLFNSIQLGPEHKSFYSDQPKSTLNPKSSPAASK